MRKIIGREGRKDLNTFIERNALKFDDVLPLLWNFDTTPDHFLGNASDIRREEDGSVTAELTFNETDRGQQAKTLVENGDCAATFFATNIKEVPRKDRASTARHINEATIRYVSVVIASQVPWE